MSLFSLGRLEISAAAQEVLVRRHLEAQSFFARHGQGDWGEKDDWFHGENDAAAHRECAPHAIRSRYKIHAESEILLVTSPDRSRTRLQLTEEYQEREIGIREGYARWAGVYDTVPNPLIAVEEPAVDALLATLPPLTSAIDVGAGTGRLARKLAILGLQDILAVDATPEMLTAARTMAEHEGHPQLRFACASLGQDPLPAASNTFDLLTAGLMLCHVPNICDAIRECARVVRPGGYLLLTDFHPAAITFGWRTDLVTPDARYLFPNAPHSRQGYLDALRTAGCILRTVQDIALGGEPYGDVSESAIQAKGLPPLCLVILAQKN